MKALNFLSLFALAMLLQACPPTKTTDTNSKSTTAEDKKDKGPRRGGGGFEAMVEKAINQDYKGVNTTSGKEEGLFPLKSTGVSTKPIVDAGNNFIETLSEEEKKSVLFKIDDKEWRHWANVDNGMFKRTGISLKVMSQKQRVALFNLLQEALSAKGLQLTKDIMKTDQTLKELNNNSETLDEELYFITIMGTPSMKEPWGFQFEGHHLAINYFILGDQVVMTPTFMGGEPIITTSGKYKGNTIFQDEQNIGLKFMQSLSEAQQKKAILSTEKGREDMVAAAFSDNVTVDFEGLKVSEMSSEQKEAILNLASQYINNMREGHAKVKMEDIKKHIDATYFAWRGTTADDAVFYYRIHSPVILIEFDHQSPVGVRGADRSPTRNYIHTMVRTPNGNDYGKDYIKQHLNDHKH